MVIELGQVLEWVGGSGGYQAPRKEIGGQLGLATYLRRG